MRHPPTRINTRWRLALPLLDMVELGSYGQRRALLLYPRGVANREVQGGVLRRLRARMLGRPRVPANGPIASPDDTQPDPKASWLPTGDADEPANVEEQYLSEVRARWLAVALDAGESRSTTAPHPDDPRSWLPAEAGTPQESWVGWLPSEEAAPEAERAPREPELEPEPTVAEPEAEPEPTLAEPEPEPEPAVAEPEPPTLAEPEPPTPEPVAADREPVATESAWIPAQPEAPRVEPAPDEPASPWFVPAGRAEAEAESQPTVSMPPEPEPTAPEPSAPKPPPAEPAAPELPAILAGSRRQTLAVESYCRELAPAAASAAAAAALGGFPGGDDLALLRRTRAIAARHATVRPPRHGWRNMLAAERHDGTCERTPRLLAMRANGELDEARRAELERHLESCVTCQAAEIRAERADRAFAGVTGIAIEAPPAVAAEAPAANVVAPGAAEALAMAAWASEAEPGSAATSEWLPPAPEPGPVRAPATYERPPIEQAPPRRPFSRHGLVGVVGGATAIAAAAVLAVVLLTSGSSTKSQSVAQSTTPAPVTRAAPAPRHKKAAAKPHHAAKKPATHHAAPSATAAASATPAATPTSQPVASSPAPAPAPTPTPAPSTPAPSQPSSVSIQQQSLGSTNAPQGIGKK
jgi:hypothetical protein